MIAMRFFPLLCVFPSGLVVILHVSHWICISSIGSDGIRKQKRRYKWNWWGFELRFYSKRHRGEQNIDKMGIWFVFIVCAWNATSLNKITWAFAFAIIEICLLCASHFNAVAYHYFKSSTPNERMSELVSWWWWWWKDACIISHFALVPFRHICGSFSEPLPIATIVITTNAQVNAIIPSLFPSAASKQRFSGVHFNCFTNIDPKK